MTNEEVKEYLNNLTIEECKSVLLIADEEGFCRIVGFGKIHKSNYERRINELKNRKMRYIAVIHGWFSSSNGFDVHELKAKTESEAHNQAKVLTYNRYSTFDNCAYTILAIEDREIYTNSLDHKLNLIPRWIRKIFKAI